MKFALFVCAGAGCLVLGACDRQSPSPQPTPTDEQRISGTERLGWNQGAADAAELASVQYAIYVDGARSVLGDALCGDTREGATFACSARLPAMAPGSHTLELAAFVFDQTVLESGRSAPFRVFVAPTAATGALAAGWQEGGIIATADGTRLRLEVVAQGLEAPTDLAFAPDGRLLIAERSGRIRIVRNGQLLSEPALDLAFDRAHLESAMRPELVALTIDPQFSRTGFVYAVYAASSRHDGRMFHIARFRLLEDTLAQRAILFDAAPASAEAAASLRFGPDGNLYAAFENAGDSRAAGDLSSVRGKILRLNPDGTTPANQPGPAILADIHSPRGLDWQPRTERLWLADYGTDGSTQLRRVAARSAFRQLLDAFDVRYRLPENIDAGSLTFYRGDALPGFEGDLLMAAGHGGFILRVHFDAQAPMRAVGTERLLEHRVGRIRVVAVSPQGEIYFCTEDSIGKLTPISGR